MINTTSLTRAYNKITARLINKWTSPLPSSESDCSLEVITITIAQLEDAIENSVRNELRDLEIFSKTFKFLKKIKMDMEKYEWEIPEVPESQLKCFFADVGFYLGICYILQNVTTVWSSFFPPEAIPSSHTARVNINPKVIEKTLEFHNLEDIFHGLITPHTPTAIETQLDAISALCDNSDVHEPISDLIAILKSNSKEYMPRDKADEDHISRTLNKILLKLKSLLEAPSQTMSLDLILGAILTGWILPQDAANLFKKLIAKSEEAENPASFLQKAEILILTNCDYYEGYNGLNDSLNANLNESLLHMSTIINHKVQQLKALQTHKPELLWNKSREEFIRTFVPLLKEKTIQQHGKKDMAPIIRLMSDLFKIKKERGEGYLEAASIESYLKEALSEHYEAMAIRPVGG